MSDYDLGFLAGSMSIDKKSVAKNRGGGWWNFYFFTK
jgi:hypothetical protein